ncbi:MAG: hypothetical protein PWP27_1100 [Clostridiales bacterium]|jgi:hypothetical protein|nr:hypothetical protein [Clostridiales bacterium]MDK2933290.1 hypothetical protein [Clostridiales bacterium]
MTGNIYERMYMMISSCIVIGMICLSLGLGIKGLDFWNDLKKEYIKSLPQLVIIVILSIFSGSIIFLATYLK